MNLTQSQVKPVTQLQRGQVYNVSSSLKLPSGTRIEVTGSGNNPIVTFDGPDGAAPFLIPSTSKILSIKDIDFKLGSKNPAVSLAGQGVVLKRLNVLKGWGLVQFRGATDVYGEDCTAKVMIDRYFVYAGTDPNTNITLRRFKVLYGSKNEHCVRFHQTFNLLLDDCDLDNSKSPKAKQSLNLRDGADHKIINSRFSGGSVIGPLGDGDGGINDPHGPKRDAKLSLRLKRVTVTNCTFNNYLILEAGVEGLLMDGCTHLLKSGNLVRVGGSYGPRKPATGSIKNAKWKGTKFINGESAGIKLSNIQKI